MEDDNGLELSLGLSCGGLSVKSKGKNGSSSDTRTEEGDKGNKLVDDFKNFLHPGTQKQDSSTGSQRNDSVKVQENFFNDLSKNNTEGDSSMNLNGRGVWVANSNKSAEMEEEKRREAGNKRKMLFDEINHQKKQEREAHADLHDKARTSHISITTEDGSTAENEDVAESEVEGSTSKLVSQHDDGPKRFFGVVGSSEVSKEVRGFADSSVGDLSGQKRFNSTSENEFKLSNVTYGVPFSIQSVNMMNVPYSLHVKESNSVAVPNMSGQPPPGMMQVMPSASSDRSGAQSVNPGNFSQVATMEENQDPKPNAPRYDLIILGASGFTGKYVVKEALRFLSHPPLRTLALAGRNPTKLTQTLQWASHPNPPPPIPIIAFDTSDPQSLLSLCAQTSLVLNCVGPFRLYGEPVVAACVETGCDYLDICGEPEFMERMEAKYAEKAAETGSLIVSACGFDSVPAELGLMFNSRQWVAPAVPNRVEAYVSLESERRMVGNLGTFESAVLGVANAVSLQALRRSRPRRARPSIPGPAPPKGPLIEHQKKIGLWAVKLPSADSIIVRRTLAALTENPHGLPGVNESVEQIEKREAFWSTVKPAHFGVKIGSKSLLGVFRFITVGMSIGLLGKFAFGRWLLLTFPSFFSLGWFRKKGPSEDEVKSASFKMWFVGHGFSNSSLVSQGNMKPDMEIITRVMGPEIGYLTTPIVLLQCALIVLSQRDNLPKGGVLPPGIVFGPTDLQERLQENGISFDVISKGALSS